MDQPSDEPATPPTPGDPPDVGSVGEEAAKLLGALAGWAKDQAPEGTPPDAADLGAAIGGLASFASHTFNEVNDHVATGAAECKYCPVCRTVHVIRETSPEVRAHLTQAASSFLQAAAGILATLPPPNAGGGAQPGRGDFERIDLDDDGPGADA